MNAARDALDFTIMRNNSMWKSSSAGTMQGHRAALAAARPDGTANDSMVAVWAVQHDRTVNVADAYE